MRIYYLKDKEKQKTRILWEEIFDTDSKSFVDYYYKEKVKDNEILVLEEDGNLVSMLQLNPNKVRFGNRIETINYIVGVATKKEYRKKGYMRKLLFQSIRDMYIKKQPFTFLMPADEAIYTPFDFHYIYNQMMCKIDFDEDIELSSDDIDIREGELGDINDLVSLTNSLLDTEFDIFIYRDEKYYKNIIKEAKAGGGNVLLFSHNNKLVGYAIYEKEDKNIIQIREPLFLKGYEEKIISYGFKLNKKEGLDINLDINIVGIDFINKSILKTENKPLIMARIIHLDSFIKNIACMNQLKFIICIKDDIINENDGIFIWTINRFGSVMEKSDVEGQLKAAQLSKEDDSNKTDLNNEHTDMVNLTISIRYLSAWLFGYVSINTLFINGNVKCLKGCLNLLKQIKTYDKVFINEVV